MRRRLSCRQNSFNVCLMYSNLSERFFPMEPPTTVCIPKCCSTLGMLITHNHIDPSAKRILQFEGDQADAAVAVVKHIFGHWCCCTLGDTAVGRRMVAVSADLDLVLKEYDESPQCVFIYRDGNASAQLPAAHIGKIATVVWSNTTEVQQLQTSLASEFNTLHNNPSGNLAVQTQCFLRSTEWRQHPCAGYRQFTLPVHQLLERFYEYQGGRSGRFSGPFKFSRLQMRAALKLLGVELVQSNAVVVLYEPVLEAERVCDARIV